MAPPGSGTKPGWASVYPDELVREAVNRDGARCRVCGRPCGDREAWRHSEPDQFGDSAANFSAMCIKCSLFLSQGGVRPARYISYSYDRGRARWLVTRLVVYSLVAMLLTFYVMFSVFTYSVIFRWTNHDSSSAAGTLVISTFVVSVGAYVLIAIWRFGRRAAHEVAVSFRVISRGVVWRSGTDE